MGFKVKNSFEKHLIFIAITLASQLVMSQDIIKKLKLGSVSMTPTFEKNDSVSIAVPIDGMSPDNYCRGCIVAYKSTNDNGSIVFSISRVLGLPNEQLSYTDSDNTFSVNNNKISTTKSGVEDMLIDFTYYRVSKFEERIDSKKYIVISDDNSKWRVSSTAAVMTGNIASGKFPILPKDACQFHREKFNCKIPKDYVFVIGDNRTSTLFGLVPIANIAGYVPNK